MRRGGIGAGTGQATSEWLSSEVKSEVRKKSRNGDEVTAAMALSYTRSSTDTHLGESRIGASWSESCQISRVILSL
jgi:hypothetical protein